MKKLILTLSLLFIFTPLIAIANQFRIGDIQYQLKGGASANTQFLYHSSGNIGPLGTVINDILLELTPIKNQTSSSVFHVAFGQLQKQDIFHTTAPLAPLELGVVYAWFDARFSESVHFEIGQIANKFSYESAISYKNDNILFGAIQRTNATYYPGFRLTYHDKQFDIRFFAEFSGPDNFSREQLSAGIQKQNQYFDFTAGIANGFESQNMIAVNIKSDVIKQMPFGLSYVHKSLDDAPANQDKSASAVGLYLNPKYKNYTFGIRGEYIDDGDTTIFNFGKGYTLTLTPAKHISRHLKIGLDLIYAKADGEPFKTESAFVEDQYGGAFQLNWVF